MANKGLAFAAGAATGYLKGQQVKKDDEERALQNEERQLRLDKLREEKADREVSLAAAKPMTLTANMVKPDTMDNRDVGLPENVDQPNMGLAQAGVRASTGQTFATQGEADKSAKAYNDPAATVDRVAAATMGRDPAKALSLQNAALTQKSNQAKFTAEQLDVARKMESEGVAGTAKAMLTGDAMKVFEAANKSGQWKFKAPPTVRSEPLNLPGYGEGTLTKYIYTGTMVGPNGEEKEVTNDSHSANMALLPYKDALETVRKGTDSENKAAYQGQMIDMKVKQLELAGQVAEAKALKAAAGGGPIGREERLRYTTLFTDSGRRVAEGQKALSALTGSMVFMSQASKPGTPQAAELEQLKASIASHAEERSLYQGLLAGSQGPAAPALSAAAPKGGPAQPTTQAEYDKLPKGARYMRDGQVFTKK